MKPDLSVFGSIKFSYNELKQAAIFYFESKGYDLNGYEVDLVWDNGNPELEIFKNIDDRIIKTKNPKWRRPNIKLEPDEVEQIRGLLSEHSEMEVAKMFEVSQSTIHLIKTKATWKNVPGPDYEYTPTNRIPEEDKLRFLDSLEDKSFLEKEFPSISDIKAFDWAQSIIKKARVDLGYSDKTSLIEIFRSLQNLYSKYQEKTV